MECRRTRHSTPAPCQWRGACGPHSCTSITVQTSRGWPKCPKPCLLPQRSSSSIISDSPTGGLPLLTSFTCWNRVTRSTLFTENARVLLRRVRLLLVQRPGGRQTAQMSAEKLILQRIWAHTSRGDFRLSCDRNPNSYRLIKSASVNIALNTVMDPMTETVVSSGVRKASHAAASAWIGPLDEVQNMSLQSTGRASAVSFLPSIAFLSRRALASEFTPWSTVLFLPVISLSSSQKVH